MTKWYGRALVLVMLWSCYTGTQNDIVPVVEEELVARLYGALRVNTNAVITVDALDSRVAVRVARVVCEADFVALARRITHEF